MEKDLFNLREYQSTDIKEIESKWNEYRSILYQLATGGGKSVIFSKIIYDSKDEQVLVLAHKRSLLNQIKRRLTDLGLNVGLIAGSTEENIQAPILIASIRTITREKRISTILDRKWDKVIIDEARHSRTGSYENVLDKLIESNPTHKLLGVDATPYRRDKKRLDKYFQYLITCSESVENLIQKGYLSKYRTFYTPVANLQQEVGEMAGDYQTVALSTYMRKPEIMDYIVNAYKKNGDERQGIVFCVDKQHALELRQKFLDHGYERQSYIDSDVDDETRELILESFRDGDIQLLFNIETLTEGVDLPETGCIIGARPTKSITLYLQMVGRGTRPKSDGSDLIVIDCCGWTEEHKTISSPRQWSLDPEIHPNNPSKKTKVVARKKDGTLSEDIEEFDELVELSPEEYLQHISGGLEKAEQNNKSIDEKILELLNALNNLFYHLTKSMQEYRDFSFHTLLDRSRITTYIIPNDKNQKFIENKGSSWRWDFAYATLIIDEDINSYFFKVDGNNYDGRRTDNKEQVSTYMRLTSVVGILNATLWDKDKKSDEIKGYYKQTLELGAQKTNLEEFKEQAKKFKREKLEKELDEYLLKSNIIHLINEKNESTNRFFSVNRGYRALKKIILSKNKITKTSNSLTFVDDAGLTTSKDYLKREEIIDCIEKLEWNKDYKEEVIKPEEILVN
jgi:superfamily II DNA or RNA helicase